MQRSLLIAGLLGSLAVACNFLISGALDDYKLADPCSLSESTSLSSSAVVVDPACAECIQKGCDTLIAPSCSGGTRKPWFSTIQSCAKDPDLRGGASACGDIFKADPAAEGAADDEGNRLRAFNCIRDKCLSPAGEPAACRSCKLFADAGPSRCGECLARACQAEIVRHCGTSQSTASDGGIKWAGTGTLLDCLSSSAPTKERCLTTLRNVPTLGPDASAEQVRDRELRSCGSNCLADCE
jgi:hypothetical protein